MSMMIGGATVALIHASRGGMNCEAFPNKLAAVLRMIDFGDLGGGIGYGCDEHKAALAEVEKQIAATRASIAEMEARDAAGESGEDGWNDSDPRVVAALAGGVPGTGGDHA